jgi:hypothetical protein
MLFFKVNTYLFLTVCGLSYRHSCSLVVFYCSAVSITDCMDQSHSWDANSHSGNQRTVFARIPRTLFPQKLIWKVEVCILSGDFWTGCPPVWLWIANSCRSTNIWLVYLATYTCATSRNLNRIVVASHAFVYTVYCSWVWVAIDEGCVVIYCNILSSHKVSSSVPCTVAPVVSYTA